MRESYSAVVIKAMHAWADDKIAGASTWKDSLLVQTVETAYPDGVTGFLQDRILEQVFLLKTNRDRKLVTETELRQLFIEMGHALPHLDIGEQLIIERQS